MRTSSAALHHTPAPAPLELPRVGVVVDARAPRATAGTLRMLSHVVTPGDLHLADSREELVRVARLALERRYETVFVAGGDASFSRFVTALLRQPRDAAARLPRLGVLPLGGGQRLAELVGASGLGSDGLLDDVLRAHAAEVPGFRRVDLLDVDGRFAPFAAVGLDAQLVHERAWIQRRLGGTPLHRLVENAGAIAPAVALHSLSTQLARATELECEVRCGVGGALLLGDDGEATGPLVPPGTVLFRGRARCVDATSLTASGPSSPAFDLRGRMRVAVDASVGVLPDLTRLLRGNAHSGSSLALLASEVTLRFAQSVPVQVGGGTAGTRDSLHLRVVQEAVELCDFSGALH